MFGVILFVSAFLDRHKCIKSAPKLWLGSIVCDRELLNGQADYKKILGVAFYVFPTLSAAPIIAPHTFSRTVNAVNNAIYSKSQQIHKNRGEICSSNAKCYKSCIFEKLRLSK